MIPIAAMVVPRSKVERESFSIKASAGGVCQEMVTFPREGMSIKSGLILAMGTGWLLLVAIKSGW